MAQHDYQQNTINNKEKKINTTQPKKLPKKFYQFFFVFSGKALSNLHVSKSSPAAQQNQSTRLSKRKRNIKKRKKVGNWKRSVAYR